MTEAKGQKSEVGSQRSEERRQKTEDRGQRTEDRGQRTEDRGQRTEDRFFCGCRLTRPFRLSPPQADDGGQAAAIMRGKADS
jgi:hypothetical protein